LPPAPRNTTARTLASARSPAQISPSRWYISQVMALRAACRSKVTVTTLSFRSVRTSPSLMLLTLGCRWPAAPADFLDDGAVVEIPLARAHAGFQHRGV